MLFRQRRAKTEALCLNGCVNAVEVVNILKSRKWIHYSVFYCTRLSYGDLKSPKC